MHILLTGVAGFIGSHLGERLLAEGHRVTGLDNFDPFYDVGLKRGNLEGVRAVNPEHFHFIQGDITDGSVYDQIEGEPEAIIHLAAKAGVRPSIADPVGYQKANVEGTQCLLEYAREKGINTFVFASSSSVYGINPKRPWTEDDHDLQPISPYASTKLSGELLGHVYSKLFDIRFIGLRFFTVYGPRQRPDLAIRKFMTKIARGETIPVFGDGTTSRDYTYVEDTVDGILRALEYTDSPYEIFNLGNDMPISLAQMIETIENVVGKPAVIDRQGNQLGDVPHTLADLTKTREKLGYDPQTGFEEGIRKMWEEASGPGDDSDGEGG